jgi:replicative DNA helicase
VDRPSRINSDPTREKLPPHHIEAEESLLSAVLIDNDTLLDILEILKPEDFYRTAHQKIFASVIDLFNNSEPVDLVTLNNALSENGQLKSVGGAPYLAGLVDTVPMAVNARHYARIIHSKAVLRRLIEKSTEIVQRCYQDRGDTDDIINFAEHAIFSVSEDKTSKPFHSISELVALNFDTLEKRSENKSLLTGIPSGFSDLDRLTSGFQDSDLIIIAARPAMGKTSFALNIARNAAVEYNIPVAVFSLEMSKEQLSMRMLCSEGHVDSSRVRSGMFHKQDWRNLTDAAGVLSEAPIYIDDSPNITTTSIRTKSRRLKMDGGLGLIIIDYLQLMRGPAKSERRDLEISEISRALKNLAKELNIPILALSQLNRMLEQRSDKRPILSDLRESGCLAGDTLIPLSSGERIPIKKLADKRNGFEILALNERNYKIEKAEISNAFSTGFNHVYLLTTSSGRVIKATCNHKFRTLDEWKRLDQLEIGEHIAAPREMKFSGNPTMKDSELALLGHLIGDGCTLPSHAIQYTTGEKDLANIVADLALDLFPGDITPRIKKERTWYQVYLASTRKHTHGVRNAISEWLTELNAFGLRSYEKKVPEKVFSQSKESVSVFLRHLWTTDGSIRVRKFKNGRIGPNIYYATSSVQLAYDVLTLLLIFGINATLHRRSQRKKGRDQYHIMIRGKSDVEKFAYDIGTVGKYKKASLEEIKSIMSNITENTNRDVVPKKTWRKYVTPSMKEQGITSREMQAKIKNAYCGTSLYNSNMGRKRAKRVALAVNSKELLLLAESDVYWDKIKIIEYSGKEETFDLTVPVHHNFIANNLFSHNSLEQDADLVAFIYRDEVYNKDENNPEKGKAEIILGKHRNGPVGTAHLAFLNTYTRFENLAHLSPTGD